MCDFLEIVVSGFPVTSLCFSLRVRLVACNCRELGRLVVDFGAQFSMTSELRITCLVIENWW